MVNPESRNLSIRDNNKNNKDLAFCKLLRTLECVLETFARGIPLKES